MNNQLRKALIRQIFKTNSTKRYWYYWAKKNYIFKSFNCWNGWFGSPVAEFLARAGRWFDRNC